jgi:hypothetical protein
MPTRIVYGVTEASTVTASQATLNRRSVQCTTAAIEVTETSATLGRDLHITCATEAITLTVTALSPVKDHAVRAPTGSVDVTFPSLDLDGTGVLAVVVTETFTARGEANYPEYVTSSFTVTEEIATSITLSLTSVINVSGAHTEVEQIATITETLTVEDSEAGAEVGQYLESTFAVSDSSGFTRELLVTGALTVTEVVTPYLVLEITETLTATEVLTGDRTSELTVSSTFNTADVVVFAGLVLEINEAANVTDSATPWRTIVESATSSFTIEDTFAATQKIETATITETATWDDSQTWNGSVYNATLTSTISVLDTIWAADLNALAWVMNTETGGLSNYDNFGYDSIAEHNGKLYATSPNGIYEIDGETDDGRAIDAELQTGFLDFDRDEKKRLSDIYVSYTGGALECTLEPYTVANGTVYTYEMEEREADAPRNNRIKVGKGVASRYWRFTFNNVSGADFQIHDVAVEAGISKRRL